MAVSTPGRVMQHAGGRESMEGRGGWSGRGTQQNRMMGESMRFVCAVVVGLAMAGVVGVAGAAPLRIASEGAYPPWNVVDSTGRLTGFEVELGAELCARMKVECVFVAQEWEGIIPGLQQGKYDAIMAALMITDERQRAISFAGPYANEPSAFLAIANGPLAALGPAEGVIDTASDAPAAQGALARVAAVVRGRTVGVQISTVQAAFLAQHLPDVVVRAYPTFEAGSLDLNAGRVDALLATRSAVEVVAKRQPGVAIVGPGLAGGLLGRGVGVGLRHSDVELKARFDLAIAAAGADGAIRRLSEKYFGFDVSVRP